MTQSPLSQTFDLILFLLKFDIIQYWKISEKKELTCCYFNLSQACKESISSQQIFQNYSLWHEDILKLSDLCDANLGQYLWMSSNENDIELTFRVNYSNDDQVADYEETTLPIRTTLVHRVKILGEGQSYLVCFSFDQLEYSAQKIDYVATICDAAFLSTSASSSLPTINEDLDSKDFFFLDASNHDLPQLPLRKLSLTSKEMIDLLVQADTTLASLLPQQQTHQQNYQPVDEVSPLLAPRSKPMKKSLPHNSSWSYTNRTLVSPQKPQTFTNPTQTYPLENLPIVNNVPDDISIESFTNLKHITFGLHSELLSATYNGTKVLLKLMLPELITSTLAQREFDHEQKLLRRINHPHIVKILGSGMILNPQGIQQFIVLEWLEDGLVDLISTSKGTDRLIRKLMPNRKSIPFPSVIAIAIDLANALDYLHNGVSPDAEIIHCQIEPENIRFDDQKTVKLIGFRASTCMRRREPNSQKGYPVLEHSGTLRYTPPEVALRLSYSEKSDVYQFGIVLWQIARDKVPFLGLSKAEYLDRVVYCNERPKIEKTWSPEFVSLLQSCCHSEQFRRPTMNYIENVLSNILSTSPGKTIKKRLSWKLSKNNEDNNGNNPRDSNDSGDGNDNAAGGNGPKAGGRRAIGSKTDGDRKSAWF